MTTKEIVEDFLEDIKIVTKNCDLLKMAFPKEEEFYSKEGEVILEVGIDKNTGSLIDYTKGNTFFMELVKENSDYNMRCWKNDLRLSERAERNLHKSVKNFAHYFYTENREL